MLKRFVSFWVYPLAALLLLAASWPSQSSGNLLAGMSAGLALWTLLEYCLHRFVFHWIHSNRRLRQYLAAPHLRHHADTHDRDRILVRLQYSLPVSAILLFGLSLWLGLAAAAAVISGAWAGFLYYEIVHYRTHTSKSNKGLLAIQRRGHFYHHFVDDDYCFGVTSPFWDYLFGTYRSVPDSQPPSSEK